MQFEPFVLVGLISILSVSCGSVFGPEGTDIIGVILYEENGPPADIQVPDTVDAGEPFTMTVTTYDHALPDACIVEGDRTDVTSEGMQAVVTPYDRSVPVGDGCPLELWHNAHTTELRFDSPGRATVLIRGKFVPRRDGPSYPADTIRTVEREIVIR